MVRRSGPTTEHPDDNITQQHNFCWPLERMRSDYDDNGTVINGIIGIREFNDVTDIDKQQLFSSLFFVIIGWWLWWLWWLRYVHTVAHSK